MANNDVLLIHEQTVRSSHLRLTANDCAGVPSKARNGPNPDRRFPAESGPEDLQVPGAAEGAAGAHAALTPGPPATEEGRRCNETRRAVCQRTKAKDGGSRVADVVAAVR